MGFLENVNLIVPFSDETECCLYFVGYALKDQKELKKKGIIQHKKLSQIIC